MIKPRGFTLIELIVVIALIGLMLFFSLPRLQNNPFLDGSKKSARWCRDAVDVCWNAKKGRIREKELAAAKKAYEESLMRIDAVLLPLDSTYKSFHEEVCGN